jgi:hypothetical protein
LRRPAGDALMIPGAAMSRADPYLGPRTQAQE